MSWNFRLGTACVASAALLYVLWATTCGGIRRVGPLPPPLFQRESEGESGTRSGIGQFARPRTRAHRGGVPSPRTRSVLLLADLHVAGPELELDAESNPMDSMSVLKAASRLYHVLEERSRHGPPSLVLVLGDVVHDGLKVLEDPNSAASLQKDLFDKAINGYTIARGLFDELLPGARIMWTFGNHDGLATCGRRSESISRALLARVYRRYFGADPFAVLDDPESNWSFVSLNGLWGPTWDPESPQCNTELASFGAPQLIWLDEVLRERQERGRHVLITTHFPLTATVAHEQGSELSLHRLLEMYPCVRGILTGHFHKGIEWSDVRSGADTLPVITLPAVRYSANNSFMLDLESDGSWSIRDFEQKNKHGARCSLGDHEDAHRGGHHTSDDCGVPLVDHETESVLPPISSMEEFPDAPEFNPEGSCRPLLAVPFFTGSCMPGRIEDNEQACCDILQAAFWPGSSHPFSTCLCIDSFWKAIIRLAYGSGGDQALVNVLTRCDRRGMFLIWPRRRSEEDVGRLAHFHTLC